MIGWATYGSDECLVLLLLAVGFSVDVDVDVVNDWQVVKFEMLAPETQFVLLLPGCPRVQCLVQAQLAEITVGQKPKRALDGQLEPLVTSHRSCAWFVPTPLDGRSVKILVYSALRFFRLVSRLTFPLVLQVQELLPTNQFSVIC